MKICCTIIAFKLYHKTCEQFYRHFGIYEKSPNSFLPGLPRPIVNQFCSGGNGIRLDCTNDEVVEVGLAVASGAMDGETLLEWVRAHRV